jgi:putative SOS response-associated peptidase YedK
MCGRLVRTSPVAVLRQLFDLSSAPAELADRWNLAPTDDVPVIRRKGELEVLRWGLAMPHPRLAGINARVESLGRGLYRDSVKRMRCLVVADGFYEWKTLPGGATRRRQPYLIARDDHGPLLMAALYDEGGGCAIVTAPATGVVATLHDRMPVILDRAAGDAWIDPQLTELSRVTALLAGARATGLVTYPVSDRVNSPKNDDPSLTERVSEARLPRVGETLSLF